MVAIKSICSSGSSGSGAWREAKASGPFGMVAPLAKRRERRPWIASISGKVAASTRPAGGVG